MSSPFRVLFIQHRGIFLLAGLGFIDTKSNHIKISQFGRIQNKKIWKFQVITRTKTCITRTNVSNKWLGWQLLVRRFVPGRHVLVNQLLGWHRLVVRSVCVDTFWCWLLAEMVRRRKTLSFLWSPYVPLSYTKDFPEVIWSI